MYRPSICVFCTSCFSVVNDWITDWMSEWMMFCSVSGASGIKGDSGRLDAYHRQRHGSLQSRQLACRTRRTAFRLESIKERGGQLPLSQPATTPGLPVNGPGRSQGSRSQRRPRRSGDQSVKCSRSMEVEICPQASTVRRRRATYSRRKWRQQNGRLLKISCWEVTARK